MSERFDLIVKDVSRPAPDVVRGFQALATTTVADVLTLDRVVDRRIHPLWPHMPRIAGPAFTVRTLWHDNLALHAAIYLAAAGDVIVVQAEDREMALAGGNVCAVAQRRGVAGFVVDGVVRDVGESRGRGFPLFARGWTPIPAPRQAVGAVNHPIRLGGVTVEPGDVVVADEEGIVVVPRGQASAVLDKARARAQADESLSLEEWERRHRARVEELLRARGLSL
jgi:regulator of RNase E activity RraA